jgi:pantoate--beta-alanine ligase
MKLIQPIPQLRRWVLKAQAERRPIGFVPTMGALHEGHLSLIKQARKAVGLRGRVVVSIFVNPTQFNQKSDLKHYPRRLSADIAKCHKAGVDLIFAPSAKAMYPEDFSTWVEETKLSKPLCGASRPGHFRGVCTVVLKLFNLVQPQVAIFGQKDAQQAAVVQRMVRDLNIPVRMIIAPIVREAGGLAMSSRNQRLSPKERESSLSLNRALKLTRASFQKGKRNANVLKKFARQQLRGIPGLRLDYLELVDRHTLQPVVKASAGDLLAVAAFFGKTRLIDNVHL